MKKNEEIVLPLDSLAGDGRTVGRQGDMVIFVEKAVPGDLARVRVWRVKKNYAEGRATEILTPSPLRAKPACKHFGVCGGCAWQNLAYEAQLDLKGRLVSDQFRHIGGFPEPAVAPVIGCASPVFYRNKMEFTFSQSHWLPDDEWKKGAAEAPGPALGLHVPGRFDKVLDLEECWLQSELAVGILRAVREICRVWNLTVYSTSTREGYLRHLAIREGKRTGELMVNIVTSTDWPEAMQNMTRLLTKQFPPITTIVNNITDRRSMVAVGDREVVYYGPGYITEQLGGYRFRVSANSFFQTNTDQAERLYETVRGMAGLKSGEVVYDLYSGTGTIAIYLSGLVERVVGVEAAASAVADAEINCRENRISNCYFLQGDVKDRLATDHAWLQEHPPPSVVVADPPRNGLHPKVVRHIVRLQPGRVVYVSCNPATQARDAKEFAAAGYALRAVQPVDMFPHTDHIESVALFVREAADGG